MEHDRLVVGHRRQRLGPAARRHGLPHAVVDALRRDHRRRPGRGRPRRHARRAVGARRPRRRCTSPATGRSPRSAASCTAIRCTARCSPSPASRSRPLIEEVIVYVGGDVPVAEYRTTGSDDLADEVVRPPRRPGRGADGQPRAPVRREVAGRRPAHRAGRRAHGAHRVGRPPASASRWRCRRRSSPTSRASTATSAARPGHEPAARRRHRAAHRCVVGHRRRRRAGARRAGRHRRRHRPAGRPPRGAASPSLPGERPRRPARRPRRPRRGRRRSPTRRRRLGPLDVVVHNAAMPKRRHVTALTTAEVDEAMALNFHAPVRMTLATLPGMLERGRGCHVNVSSLGGRLGIAHEAAYCATKFALARLGRGDGHRPVGHAASTSASCCPAPSTPRSGTSPATTRRSTTARSSRRRRWPTPSSTPSRATRFEVYSPDMRGIVEWKTARPRRLPRRRRRDGAEDGSA